MPRYGRPDYMSATERDHVRALYAAQVTLVDRWVGRLLEKIETLGLDRNTLIIYLSDHGHLFAEHGLQGKPTEPLEAYGDAVVAEGACRPRHPCTPSPMPTDGPMPSSTGTMPRRPSSPISPDR